MHIDCFTYSSHYSFIYYQTYLSSYILPFHSLPTGQQKVLPLHIKNSEIISSHFTARRLTYGSDRYGDGGNNASIRLVEDDYDGERVGSDNNNNINSNKSNNNNNNSSRNNNNSNKMMPAQNLSELSDRVEKVMTKKLRKMQQLHPEPFHINISRNKSNDNQSIDNGNSIENHSDNNNTAIERSNGDGGDGDDDDIVVNASSNNNYNDDNNDEDEDNKTKDKGFIRGYSSLSLDVLCAPLTLGRVSSYVM